MPTAAPFTITRVFVAPRALLYAVNTEVNHLGAWMSPEGFRTIRAYQDLRPGGTYHYGLAGPGGLEMWGRQRYVELVPNERIVLVQSFSDKDGGLTRHPMAATWPLELLATTTFEDAGPGQTRVTISWVPYQSDEAGNATFDGARDGMVQGFEGTFSKLSARI